ncbi:hypothetical protein, partial [Pseudomonas sp. MWU12-2323]|uniref:hypothetical protein n=1 Tax=Pseudomonas sp. MWU12-2323 TaxID=2651296 RepID=UPI001C49B5C8
EIFALLSSVMVNTRFLPTCELLCKDELACGRRMLRPADKTPAPVLRRLAVLFVLSAAVRLGPDSLRGFASRSKPCCCAGVCKVAQGLEVK